MAAKSSNKKPVEKTKVTVGGVGKRSWTRFLSKCNKANISASARIRQLIEADIKV